jgi:energy-coupling factor transporter transmembrane protein EcfT
MKTAHIQRLGFHPLFWWVWAVLTSGVVLVLDKTEISLAAIGSCLLMASRFKNSTYWRSSFKWILRLALIAFAFRMLIGFTIGVPMPGQVIFTLPQIQLPELLVGIRLGGPVTEQRLLLTLNEAALLAALILIFALANSLSNPHSLLKVLPRRFYGIGLASVIATSVAPQAARSISRVRTAKRLRGQSGSGLQSWKRIALPVLEDSLERSIDLAASLESRGYGYFPNTTRYRAQSWQLRDSLGVSGPAYLLIAIFIAGSISPWLISALFLFLTLTPVVA